MPVTKAESSKKIRNDQFELDGTIDAGGLCSEGLEMLKMKRWSEAVEVFTEALKFKPDDPSLHLHCALANVRLKKYQDAEGDCTRALGLKPDLIKAYLRRSKSRKLQGKFTQAALDLVKVMELQQEFELPMSVTRGEYDDLVFLAVDELHLKQKAGVWAQNEQLSRKEEYFGGLLVKQQNWNEAILKLTNSIKLTRSGQNPRLRDLFLRRGDCWKSLGYRKYNLAEADYTSAISMDDKNFTVYYKRSVVRSEMGNKTGALEDLIRMYVLNPNSTSMPSSLSEGLASGQLSYPLPASEKEKMYMQRQLGLKERRKKLAKISNSHPMDQKKFDEYLIGYIDREDENFSLAKLKEEAKIMKPVEAVEEILNGKGFTKSGVFDLLDFDLRSQTITVYNLLSASPDWETLKKIVALLRNSVHPDMLKYALATSVYHHPKKFKMAPPNWFEVFPNFILPASTLRDLYRRKMKGVKDTVVYVNIANETVVGKNKYFNAFSETDPEAKLRYFRDDTSLSNMFLNWHLHFPNWREVGKDENTEKWEDRGHLFYYFHQQLVSRYNLERIYNKLEPVDGLSWSNVEMGRYVLDLLDYDGDPIPGRHAGHPNTQNTWWKRMEDVQTRQKRIGEAVDSNLVLSIKQQKLEPFYPGSELYQLGNMISGTDNSSHPEYYGSYFFDATDAVNILGKGDIADNKEPGFFFKMLTTLRDPIFFQLLENICTFFRSYASTYLQEYKEIDKLYNYHGLSLDSVQVGHLSTYFDYEEIDVTKAIDLAPRETTDDIKYRAKILKLSHKPFAYDVTISLNNSYEGLANGEKTTKVMFRLFLGPENDWRGQKMEFDLSKHYFVEIDRFPIELETGTNIVSRNSKDSSIYVDGELNYARVDDLIRLGRKTKKDWDLSFLKEIAFCGLPNNLMLPKGDAMGAKFRMIALITPFNVQPQNDQIREFKSFPLCGQPRYMDHWTGFPFDRIFSVHDDYFRSPFAISQVVTIHHHNQNS